MNALYAWVCNDRGKGEEIIACVIFAGDAEAQTVPMVVSHREMAEKMRPAAVMHMKNTGKPVYLRRFIVGETLEIIEP